jgi:hypothetical protein
LQNPDNGQQSDQGPTDAHRSGSEFAPILKDFFAMFAPEIPEKNNDNEWKQIQELDNERTRLVRREDQFQPEAT